jgi:hypothetical protein
MIRGCLTLSGLGLVSLFAFGVTLEAINDSKELSAIPFTPWDFLTYGLITVAVPTLILVVRKRDPRRTLRGKWTSHLTHNGARFRTTLHLDPNGNAVIQTEGKAADSEQRLRTSGRWQLLDDSTLHLSGSRSVTWKILKLNRWSMTTAGPADLDFPVQWLKRSKIDTKACLLVAGVVLLPILFALSLPRSEPSHVIADDPQYVPSNTSPHP